MGKISSDQLREAEKPNRLVTAELQKKLKKMPRFDPFPRPGEIDPSMLSAI